MADRNLEKYQKASSAFHELDPFLNHCSPSLMNRRGYKNFRYVSGQLFTLRDSLVYSLDTSNLVLQCHSWLGRCDTFEISDWDNQLIIVTTLREEGSIFYRNYQIHNVETRELLFECKDGDSFQALHINQRSAIFSNFERSFNYYDLSGNRIIPRGPDAVLGILHSTRHIFIKTHLDKWVCHSLFDGNHFYDLNNVTSIISIEERLVYGISTKDSITVSLKVYDIENGSLLSYHFIDKKYIFEDREYLLDMRLFEGWSVPQGSITTMAEELSRGSITFFYMGAQNMIVRKYDLNQKKFDHTFDRLPGEMPVGHKLYPFRLNISDKSFALTNRHNFLLFSEDKKVYQSPGTFVPSEILDFTIYENLGHLEIVAKCAHRGYFNLKPAISLLSSRNSKLYTTNEDPGVVTLSSRSKSIIYSIDSRGILRRRRTPSLEEDFEVRILDEKEMKPQAIIAHSNSLVLGYFISRRDSPNSVKLFHVTLRESNSDVSEILSFDVESSTGAMCLCQEDGDFYFGVSNKIGHGCVATGSIIKTVKIDNGSICSIASSENLIFAGTHSGSIISLDKELNFIGSKDCYSIWDVSSSIVVNGSNVISAEGSEVKVRDQHLSLLADLKYHSEKIREMQVLKSKKLSWLVSAGDDGKLVFWNLANFEPIVEYSTSGDTFLFSMCQGRSENWFWTNNPDIIGVFEESNGSIKPISNDD